MPLRCLRIVCFIGIVFLVTAHARAAAPRAAHTTVTYDVGDLLAGTKIDKIVTLIFRTTGPTNWSATRKGAATLDVVNGTQIQVRAGAELHRQIADLLASLRRPTGPHVQLRAELHEVDRAFYEKQIKPRLEARQALANTMLAMPVEAEVAVALRRRSKAIQSRTVRIGDERRAMLVSLRRLFTYGTLSGAFPTPSEGFGTGSTGVALAAHVGVSADRNSVRVKLEQTTSELVEIRKTSFELDNGDIFEIESPRIREQSTTTTVRVSDGGVLLVPVHAQLDRERGKDKVWALVVRVTIPLSPVGREKLP
jgi:hypothetical protein